MTNNTKIPLSADMRRRAFLKYGAVAFTAAGMSWLGKDAQAQVARPTGAAIMTKTEAGTPVYGGTMTVAYVGGGAAETLDPSLYGACIDNNRGMNLFDRLTYVTPELEIANELAERFEPSEDFSSWTIHLRPGVKFHDGSDFTADDVIFTLQRIIGDESTSPGKPIFDSILGENAMEKVDDLTLVLHLSRSFVPLPDAFSDYWMCILKNGTTDFAHPIGTGPFMYAEFSPGGGSRMVKNPTYWREGQPYLDELVFVSIPNGETRLSALKAGQVQAMEGLTFTQVRQNKDATDMVVLEGAGPVFTPFVMSMNLPPFDDVRVRQAFKLICDRDMMQMAVLAGFGDKGNDLYGKGLPNYADTIPQREQDIETAKALLAEAGYENLELTLHTAALWPAQVESAQIFAQQAKQAGVTINIDMYPADQYFADVWAQKPLFQSNWQAQPIATWMQTALIEGGLFNESGFNDEDFTRRIYEAQAEGDPSKAKALWDGLQETLWNEGPYLIWGFFPYLDGLAPNVRGASGSGWVQLGAGNFREWWLA